MTQWVTSEDETATRCTTSKPSSRSSTTEARGPGLPLDWFIYFLVREGVGWLGEVGGGGGGGWGERCWGGSEWGVEGVTKVDRFPHIHERPVIYFDFLIICTCMHS